VHVDHAIERVAEAEQALASGLAGLAARHPDEHDVYQMAQAQAGKVSGRLASLADMASRYGTSLPTPPSAPANPAARRSDVPGLALLDDMQEAYVAAARAEIAWVVLIQAGRAMREGDLVHAVTTAHEECETTAKWLRTRIKVAAPQAVIAG
jgi:hypothetical protein